MATARENAFDNTVVPGAEYTKSARFKEDLYNAGTPDEAKAQTGFFDRLLRRKFPKFGPGGRPTGETNAADELGYLPANFSAVMQELGEVKAILRSLALGQGVTIDYDEIARKVADEEDRRDRERLGKVS